MNTFYVKVINWIGAYYTVYARELATYRKNINVTLKFLFLRLFLHHLKLKSGVTLQQEEDKILKMTVVVLLLMILLTILI